MTPDSAGRPFSPIAGQELSITFFRSLSQVTGDVTKSNKTTTRGRLLSSYLYLVPQHTRVHLTLIHKQCPPTTSSNSRTSRDSFALVQLWPISLRARLASVSRWTAKPLVLLPCRLLFNEQHVFPLHSWSQRW